MSVVDLGPVVRSVDVRRTPVEAFRLFTEQMAAWWPLKTHSRAKDAAGEITLRVEFEGRVGGRIFETLNTGEQRDWGEVLVYEPGRRVVFSFQFGRPRDKAGEVEVRFDPLEPANCRVTLTHSHWDRLGAEAAQVRGRFAAGFDAVFVHGFGAYAGLISHD
jgi:uncharacterized protein YndB with AHSA1/START domain